MSNIFAAVVSFIMRWLPFLAAYKMGEKSNEDKTIKESFGRAQEAQRIAYDVRAQRRNDLPSLRDELSGKSTPSDAHE